ncbi:MAG: DUF1573 domain-containing protein [Bacteroidales bacterium]|nr:DUF1573 domain-containing protein [Bacteroidales bacterium]
MNLMNRIILTSLVMITLLLSQCGNADKKSASGIQASDTGTVKIVFNEYEHAFGKVAEGEKVGYVFKFENQGTANLVIASATTSCGCTVPEYDSKPIPPGGSGTLEVVFNTSGRNGMQTKTITVKSNAQPPVVILKITAEVVKDKQ